MLLLYVEFKWQIFIGELLNTSKEDQCKFGKVVIKIESRAKSWNSSSFTLVDS